MYRLFVLCIVIIAIVCALTGKVSSSHEKSNGKTGSSTNQNSAAETLRGQISRNGINRQKNPSAPKPHAGNVGDGETLQQSKQQSTDARNTGDQLRMKRLLSKIQQNKKRQANTQNTHSNGNKADTQATADTPNLETDIRTNQQPGQQETDTRPPTLATTNKPADTTTTETEKLSNGVAGGSVDKDTSEGTSVGVATDTGVGVDDSDSGEGGSTGDEDTQDVYHNSSGSSSSSRANGATTTTFTPGEEEHSGTSVGDDGGAGGDVATNGDAATDDTPPQDTDHSTQSETTEHSDTDVDTSGSDDAAAYLHGVEPIAPPHPAPTPPTDTYTDTFTDADTETGDTSDTDDKTPPTTPEVDADIRLPDKDPKEDLPSYEEWKQQKLAATEKQEKELEANQEQGNGVAKNGRVSQKSRTNYAAASCGAKILQSNPEAKNPASILNENKDYYMIQPCKAKKWFIVELCEHVQIQSIEIANFELFSSLPESFVASISDRYQPKEWKKLGKFHAREERTIQSFSVQDAVNEMYAKYIKIDMLGHFGNEHYCPLTILRVYGSADEEFDSEQHDVPAPDIDNSEDIDDVLLQSEESDGKKSGLLASATDTLKKIVEKVLNPTDDGGDSVEPSDDDIQHIVDVNKEPYTNKSQTNADSAEGIPTTAAPCWPNDKPVNEEDKSTKTEQTGKKDQIDQVSDVVDEEQQTDKEPQGIEPEPTEPPTPAPQAWVQLVESPTPSPTPSSALSMQQECDCKDTEMDTNISPGFTCYFYYLMNKMMPPKCCENRMFFSNDSVLVRDVNKFTGNKKGRRKQPVQVPDLGIINMGGGAIKLDVDSHDDGVAGSKVDRNESDEDRKRQQQATQSSGEEAVEQQRAKDRMVDLHEEDDGEVGSDGKTVVEQPQGWEGDASVSGNRKENDVNSDTEGTRQFEEGVQKAEDGGGATDDTAAGVDQPESGGNSNSGDTEKQTSEDVKSSKDNGGRHASGDSEGREYYADTSSGDELRSTTDSAGDTQSAGDEPYQKVGRKDNAILKNRIKDLELDLKLTSQYLEELSKSYRRKMEEMYDSLNKTINKLLNTSKSAEIRYNAQSNEMKSLREEVNHLTEYTAKLQHTMDTMETRMADCFCILFGVQLVVFSLALVGYYLYNKGRAQPSSHDITSTPHVPPVRIRTVSGSVSMTTLKTPARYAKGHKRHNSTDLTPNRPTRPADWYATGSQDDSCVSWPSEIEPSITIIKPLPPLAYKKLSPCPKAMQDGVQNRKKRKKKGKGLNGSQVDFGTNTVTSSPSKLSHNARAGVMFSGLGSSDYTHSSRYGDAYSEANHMLRYPSSPSLLNGNASNLDTHRSKTCHTKPNGASVSDTDRTNKTARKKLSLDAAVINGGDERSHKSINGTSSGKGPPGRAAGAATDRKYHLTERDGHIEEISDRRGLTGPWNSWYSRKQ